MVAVIIERGSLLGSLGPALLLKLFLGIHAMLLLNYVRYHCELCAVMLTLVGLFETLSTEVDRWITCHLDQIKYGFHADTNFLFQQAFLF
jgi:hypothetical protein